MSSPHEAIDIIAFSEFRVNPGSLSGDQKALALLQQAQRLLEDRLDQYFENGLQPPQDMVDAASSLNDSIAYLEQVCSCQSSPTKDSPTQTEFSRHR